MKLQVLLTYLILLNVAAVVYQDMMKLINMLWHLPSLEMQT